MAGGATVPPTLTFGLLAFVALASAYVLFADSLVGVFRRYSEPEFSHGYIIPLISAWIIWQRRQLIRDLRTRGSVSGLWLIASGVGIAVLGNAAHLVSIPYLGLIVAVIGSAATAWGWVATRLLLVPIGFLFFGFPLPGVLYVELSVWLQLISSKLGAFLLEVAGIPVYLDGNIIDLGTMKLQVAEACSGLRYLFPLLTFGTICAFLYRGPLWAKLVIVAVTVPLTIGLNSARIALTGVFVHAGSQELAEGFMHLFEGWVIFVLALTILFALMFGLLRVIGANVRFVDILDFDRMAGTPHGQAPRGSTEARTATLETPPRPLIVAVVLMAFAAAVVVAAGARPQTIPERPGLTSFPLQLGEWRGRPQLLEPAIEENLGASDYLLVDFERPSGGDFVNLWVAYYASQVGGSQIHLPTTCLPGAGWEYVAIGPREMPLADFSGAPLMVNRGVITKGTQRIVMYFWIELRGHALHESQYTKLVNLRDALVRGRSDGALVRLFTPLAANEAPAAGDARLVEMLQQVYPLLEPHVGP